MNSGAKITRRKQRRKRMIAKSIAVSLVIIGLIVSVRIITYDPNPVSAADVTVSTQATSAIATSADTASSAVTSIPTPADVDTSELATNNEEDVCNDSYITDLLMSSGPGYDRLIDTMDDAVIDLTKNVGTKYDIEPELIQAIIFYESSNRQDVSNGTCVGLMQVSTKWHAERAESLNVDLYDSYGNVLTGTDYLAELYDEHENITTALMVYHGESDALIKAENGQTSTYVNNIMNLYSKLTDLKVMYENR